MKGYEHGYKWANGLPMPDKFHGTVERFYKYAKAQGNTQTKEEVYATFEKMIMKPLGFKTQKGYYG